LAKQPYEVAVAQMKANATDPASRKAIAEAEKMIKDSEWTDKKMGAEIDKLHAEANKLNSEAVTSKTKIDRESLNEQASRLIEFVRLKEAKGEPVHPADIQAIKTIQDILRATPPVTIQSAIAKDISVIAKDMAAKQAGAKPSNVAAGKITIQPTWKDKAGKPYYKWPDGSLHYNPPK
jgi:hypothetical protein